VVLSQERHGKIVREADEWVNVFTTHKRYKILKKSGEWFGEIRIGSSKFSRVSDIQARTIKPDGTVVNVLEDQIFETLAVKTVGYKRKEWVFNFPSVEPGAILEFRYKRYSNYLNYITPWYFAGPGFTLRSSVSQVIPDKAGYSILCDLCPPGLQPTVTKWREGKAKGQRYSMELTNIPGYRSEILMPPVREVSPRMEMVLHTWKGRRSWALGRQDRFFVDWESVAHYARAYYDEAVKDGGSKFESLVEGWVQGIEDPTGRIRTIVGHVREDFRYIHYQYVSGWSRKLEKILKEKSADNEEKAVLLNAALKKNDVESYIALVVGKDVGSLNPNFTSLSQFSHAVVAIPKSGGGYLWLDPTVTYAPFDFVPWEDSGAQALLLKKTGGELIDIPIKNSLNTTRYRVTVTPNPTGRAALEIEAEFRGEDAIDMRDRILPVGDNERKKYLQAWLDDMRDGAVLSEYTIEQLENFDKPLLIKMKAEAPGLVTLADGVMAVRACVLSCYDSNPISKGERSYPLYVDRGWNEEETVIIESPEGMVPAPAPAPVVARTAVALMNLRCTQQGESGMRCTRQFIARRNRWPVSQLVRVREMFDKIVEADQTRVVFQTR
ncbi:MAG: DUF3857 domain-containing protein, partial [Acidobacteria bacterium]|nr:DUF3857 domain-containing protein [Acidobacteriota bacterium]